MDKSENKMNPPKPLDSYCFQHEVYWENENRPPSCNLYGGSLCKPGYRRHHLRLWARQLADKMEKEAKYADGLYADLERANYTVARSMVKRLKEIRKELLFVAGDEKT